MCGRFDAISARRFLSTTVGLCFPDQPEGVCEGEGKLTHLGCMNNMP